MSMLNRQLPAFLLSISFILSSFSALATDPFVFTAGFFVDSALADIRLDRVIFLIVITAMLNIGVDSLSRHIRSRLRLSNQVEQT